MTLQNTVHHGGKSGQEFNTGTKAETWGMPLSGARTLPGCYLSYTFQTHSSGNAPHTVAWILLHQLEIKKIPYRFGMPKGCSDVSNSVAILSSQERVGCVWLATANSAFVCRNPEQCENLPICLFSFKFTHTGEKLGVPEHLPTISNISKMAPHSEGSDKEEISRCKLDEEQISTILKNCKK